MIAGESRLERRGMIVIFGLLTMLGVAIYASNRFAIRPRRFDTSRAMIPMRDGIKLETVIFTPKGARAPLPIMLQRTPYGVIEGDGEPGTSGLLDDMLADG